MAEFICVSGPSAPIFYGHLSFSSFSYLYLFLPRDEVTECRDPAKERVVQRGQQDLPESKIEIIFYKHAFVFLWSTSFHLISDFFVSSFISCSTTFVFVPSPRSLLSPPLAVSSPRCYDNMSKGSKFQDSKSASEERAGKGPVGRLCVWWR